MGIRSFRGRIFLALLAIGVIPMLITLGAGAFALRSAVDLSGSAGPWTAVAESGARLIERIGAVGADDPELAAAIDEHTEALENSARLSNIYAAVTRRFSGSLPLVALGFFALVGIAALVAAGWLSRGLAAPTGELVDWTGRIARGDALPASDRAGDGPAEFDRLRTALRSMVGEIEEGRRRAVESARLRSWTEMARTVAHEIKNPLTPIQISAAALTRDDRPPVAEAAEIILDEVAKLDELARSFAQLGRMPEGPGAPVDLVELLGALAERHRSESARIEVDAPAPVPLVPGHQDALVRVFRNLIGNALEAMSGHEVAEVTLRLEATPDHVAIHVLDRGPGFTEEALQSIWSSDFTTKVRGSGIGLTLVRSTIEAHGGAVGASNRPDGGADVLVRLPIRARET